MTDEEVERAVAGVNVIDEIEPQRHHADRRPTRTRRWPISPRASAEHPDRIDLKRGLAPVAGPGQASRPRPRGSGARSSHSAEATPEDRVELADALIRAGDWDKAEARSTQIPPTYETFDRYRLEAMVADANKDWKKADSFYETAVGLTTQPGRAC